MSRNAYIQPGVYPNMPAPEYHGVRAFSNSLSGHMLRSPAHAKVYQEQGIEDTPALLLGRATHAAVLEPDAFPALFHEAPEVDRRTKAGKEAWAGAEEKAHMTGAELLRAADYQTCLAIRDAVHRSKAAKALLSGAGEVELSLFWNDQDTGVYCKGRLDRLSKGIGGGAIVDLKTTRDASRLAFERTIFNRGYHRQGYLYTTGAEGLGLAAKHYAIIAVEKEPPYGVAVYRLTEGAIQAGGDQIRPLLERYQQCMENDEWPGYPDRVEEISLPAWAWNANEEQIEEAA